MSNNSPWLQLSLVDVILAMVVVFFIANLIVADTTPPPKIFYQGHGQMFNREHFDIQYGLPPGTSDDDHGHIKNLITLGSQADANKQYDVVSTEHLGDISRPAPPPPPPPPPDPVCFVND